MARSKSALRIAIIGAGPTGIAAGHELLRRGFGNFTLLEKESAPGGTWHMHSYPGLACDVWAHSYTFSYAPNPRWSANFVLQPEIEAYLRHCATAFGLDPHIRLNTRVVRAVFREPGEWVLHTAAGEELVFDVVINAMGNQHTPLLPALKNRGAFRGASWHSSNWNHDVELAGKRVIVVGSAAAAVQIVPELAPTVAHLSVLQRTPNWVLPRHRKLYSARLRALFRTAPALMRLLRWGQGKLMGFMHQGALLGHKRQSMFEQMGRKHIAQTIMDPALRVALTPSSRFGCKRPLVSDDFYPALNRDNVRLLACGASEETATGLITCDGEHLEADVIIYCTGYRVLDFDRIDVVGEHGQHLAELMEKTPHAYKGIAVPGFPNYFMGMGPNALVLSVSYFMSAEANVECIVRLLGEMLAGGATRIAATGPLTREYNQWLDSQFAQFSWGSADCVSYYQTASGQSPFLFPGDFATFLRHKRATGLAQFHVA
jgi:cation diffusion facilitator CzcD-associated flavoprotein CzcO